MIDYKFIEEMKKKYYYSASKNSYMDNNTRQPVELSEDEKLGYNFSSYISGIIAQRLLQKKIDIYSDSPEKETAIKEILGNIESSFEEGLKNGKFKQAFIGVVHENGKSTIIPTEVTTFWQGIMDNDSKAVDTFRFMLRGRGKDLDSFYHKQVDNDPTHTLFFTTKPYAPTRDSGLEKLKSYKPVSYDKGDYLKLDPNASKRRMDFVNAMISSYDAIETEDEHKQRVEEHMYDAKRITEAIRDNNFSGNRTADIGGSIDYDEKGNMYTFYSETEIKRMAQMLKVAKAMSERTGEDYLEAFLNQPNVNQILLRMRQDRKDNLKSIKEKANNNIRAGKVPNYRDSLLKANYDPIIKKTIEDGERLNTDQDFLAGLQGMVEENPTYSGIKDSKAKEDIDKVY